jgi:hypothetical protein
MKTTLLILAAGLFSTALIQAQNPLPNPGFEDWSTFSGSLGSTYGEPNDWNSANQCSSLLGTYSVAQTADAHNGTSAAELKTRNAFIGSVKINGLLTTSTVLCGLNSGGNEGGIASTVVPDSITFWYKYAPATLDTAYAQVILFNDTDTISYVKGKIFEPTTIWTRISLAIPAPTESTNIISTLFNSSWGDGSLGQAVVGSIFIVDDVEFVFATGIDEQTEASKWEVYPNPVNEILNIRNTSGKAGNLEMIDATGRIVVRESIAQMQTQLNVNHLPTGLYLYQLKDLRGQVITSGKLLRSL